MDMLGAPLHWFHTAFAPVTSTVVEEAVRDEDVHIVDIEEGLTMAAG